MARRTFLLLLGMVLALSAARATLADDEGFTCLFNGKDLTGWVQPDVPTIFAVEDGVIVGRTQGDLKHNEFLATEKSYKDFHFKAKVLFKNGNSGIQFRSERLPNGAMRGPQADIAAEWWGGLYDEAGKRGVIERYPIADALKIVKQNDWNAYEIIAKGNHVVITLNGTKILDRDDPLFPKEGKLGLQTHVGPPMEVKFKDISIKELSPAK